MPGTGKLEDVLGQGYKEVKVERLLELLNSMCGQKQEYTEESVKVTTQKYISHSIVLASILLLQEKLVGEGDKARFNSVGMAHAGDWPDNDPISLVSEQYGVL